MTHGYVNMHGKLCHPCPIKPIMSPLFLPFLPGGHTGGSSGSLSTSFLVLSALLLSATQQLPAAAAVVELAWQQVKSGF